MLESTPEEHAYHQGWCAYFIKSTVNINPYDRKYTPCLYKQWETGKLFAKLVENSMIEA